MDTPEINCKQKLSELSIADLLALHANPYVNKGENDFSELISTNNFEKIGTVINKRIDNIDWDN